MSKHSLLSKISLLFVIGIFVYGFFLPMVSSGASVFAVDANAAALDCPKQYNSKTNAELTWSSNDAKSRFPSCTNIETGELGFQIPSLGDILTFAIRAFFVIAGLAALFYMLIGAFAWVTSGGDKDAVSAAREKIQAAVVGMILIVAVLAIIWTLEQVIFKRRVCLGLSCPLTLPGLIERTTDGDYCCVCVNRNTNALGQIVNTAKYKCDDAGQATAL
ncbi:hypothetical protein IPM65_02085 [Candidatus Roizmanbacteria bacterium]|nr:MAG: hypothetical protein IPM65_02085 [Candidatus Roizmanbacteria bacterium]